MRWRDAIPEDEEVGDLTIRGEVISDSDIEAMLADLAQTSLGLDRDREFRISMAGAQEKTALLRLDGHWLRTPTTHILKPQLGQIPTSDGMIDMSDSVDNEHYCMKVMEAFGLKVAQMQIVSFRVRRVLSVERFDRSWRKTQHIIRLPQEDGCQALGIPHTLKYQSEASRVSRRQFQMRHAAISRFSRAA